MTEEKTRVEEVSSWYLKEQLDFDKRLIRGRYETLKEYIIGPNGLELGSADGQMTQFLLNDFESLTIVDGAKDLLAKIPEASNLQKVHSLFEEYKPPRKFNTIILEHILEHVENPVGLLKCVKDWLLPDGRMLLGVPNGHSIHRLVAVKMGLLKDPCELNPRDLAQGHRRVYTPDTFKEDIGKAGLSIEKMGGVFFKPLSNQQIQDNWNEEMIQGFYELGKEFPWNAADLYAVCRLEK
jgi:2-polyprenyl-3-methyl-5-hydroxy-6-metoxy-1,4-benzoquinol methylase